MFGDERQGKRECRSERETKRVEMDPWPKRQSYLPTVETLVRSSGSLLCINEEWTFVDAIRKCE